MSGNVSGAWLSCAMPATKSPKSEEAKALQIKILSLVGPTQPHFIDVRAALAASEAARK